jgi:hypothetical protein
MPRTTFFGVPEATFSDRGNRPIRRLAEAKINLVAFVCPEVT